MGHRLRLHSFLPCSQANGPGWRAVIWVQGCSLGCEGCFNPETHSARGGRLVAVDRLFARISALAGEVEGVTVSGGEPLEQPAALLNLLRRIRGETDLSVLLFTGYTWDEAQRLPQASAVLECVDILLAGRYDRRQHVASALLGSANQKAYFLTNRYSEADLEEAPAVEVFIDESGEVVVSGIAPPGLGYLA